MTEDGHAQMRESRGEDARPNVLWISTHDINPDLGAYQGIWPGAEYADTPVLDELASNGALYTHAYASAPVCAPSRSAIMTGCHPSAIGTLPMRTKAVPPPEVRLLSEYFREAGYYVTNNVFADFQVQTPPTAFDECSTTAHWRKRPSPSTPFFAGFHSSITHESRLYYDEHAFAAETADVSEERRHDPAVAPLPPYYPDTPAFRETWARYGDLVTQMDHWVGGLLGQLAEDGLDRDTIVVFWVDHGVGMPRAKRWANEAGLRVPLIVRWPGVLAPSRRPELVHCLDLAPTILAACGLPVPDHMHGRPVFDSEGRYLDPNPAVFGGRARIDEQEDASLTVRDRRYRYVRHAHPDRSPMQHSEYPDKFVTWREFRRLAFADSDAVAKGLPERHLSPIQRAVLAPGRPPEELYDHDEDPYELVNLASDPGHTDDLRRLRGLLDEWQQVYANPWPASERQQLDEWRPGGELRVTSAPVADRRDGALHASCDTPGASIGWTTDPSGPVRPRTQVEEVTGAPVDDGRHWHLYTAPIAVPDVPVTVGAWRLGFAPSREILVDASRSAEDLSAETSHDRTRS